MCPVFQTVCFIYGVSRLIAFITQAKGLRPITSLTIQKLKKELYDIIANHSGQTYEKVWADSDRDYWMIAQEAKDYGMIDEVLMKK